MVLVTRRCVQCETYKKATDHGENMLIKARVDIIKKAKALCVKCIARRKTGRERSVEICMDCEKLLHQIAKEEAGRTTKNGNAFTCIKGK